MDRACQQGLHSLTGHDRVRVTTRFPAVTAYFLLGKVLKSHGTSGQLRLLVDDKYKSYIRPGVFLFFDLDGAKVPYEVSEAEDDAHFVIALQGVDRKEMSDVLSGRECWLPVEHVRKHHLRNRPVKKSYSA